MSSAATSSPRGLRSFLTAHRYRGRLSLPREPIFPPVSLDTSRLPPGVAVSAVATKEVKEEVGNYMRRNFYRRAIIPSGLRLLERAPCLVEEELEMLLDSGQSLAFRDADSGRLLGASLNVAWKVEKDGMSGYLFGGSCADASEWFRAASDIAEREEDVDRAVMAWRNHLYLIIYQLLQAHGRDIGALYVQYLAAIYLEPSLRGKRGEGGGLPTLLTRAMAQEVHQRGGCCFLMSTYRGFDFGGDERTGGRRLDMCELARVPYRRLAFSPPGEHPRVFNDLGDEQGISFWGTFEK